MFETFPANYNKSQTAENNEDDGWAYTQGLTKTPAVHRVANSANST